jgi:ATP-binding protein involved in chromosome partitioning
MAQRMPVSGAVIVTTPQDIALLDALKGLKMFEKVNVPVLGIIENMSTHVCSKCGHEEHIFGEGGAKKMAEEAGIEMLGELPLDIRIRMDSDSGQPVMVTDPKGNLASAYRSIAARIVSGVEALEKAKSDGTQCMPNIVME